MTTTVTFLGHGTFLVETNGTHVLIDPFLTDNPVASTTAEEVPAEVIILTHGHGDHVGDVIAGAQRTGAMVIANFEIVEWLGGQGIENTHPLHIGGQHAFEWGTVKLTIAHHGSMLPDGSCGGNPAGVLLKLSDGTIYHAADTGLFYDMKLIGETGSTWPSCQSVTTSRWVPMTPESGPVDRAQAGDSRPLRHLAADRPGRRGLGRTRASRNVGRTTGDGARRLVRVELNTSQPLTHSSLAEAVWVRVPGGRAPETRISSSTTRTS
ncbi:MAG: hypothetical protein Ct9H300mP1_20230 [Planctomycetaceae bacterium]|nr:MAG: hypothetical protein Ct9H300mP1_20230 [Planctomycetaceae bacterium]